MTGAQFTRRHWGREALDLVLFPITMLMSKTGPRDKRQLSMQRVILAVFVVQFFRHFPTTWTMPAVAALAVLTFALIVETLFAAVPVKEGLAALVAIFGGAVAKRTRTTTYEETEVEPAPRVPSEEPEMP